MLFVDYFFDLLPNGSIMMDPELKAESVDMKNGDMFKVFISYDGRIILEKVKEKDGSS